LPSLSQLPERVAAAFSPFSYVRDPRLFVGRVAELEFAKLFLEFSGSLLFVYGARSLGKTSFVRHLIFRLNAAREAEAQRFRFFPLTNRDYEVYYFSCAKALGSKEHILTELLYGDGHANCLYRLADQPLRAVKESKATLSGDLGVSFKIVSASGATGREVTYAPNPLETDPQSEFRRVLSHINQQFTRHDRHLLLVLDELDLLPNCGGLAHTLHDVAEAYDRIKFCLVGASDNLLELVDSHQSLARQCPSIHLRRMPSAETAEILLRAEEVMERRGLFTPEAQAALVSFCGGLPYWMQLAGQQTALAAVADGAGSISAGAVEEVLRALAGGTHFASSTFEDMRSSLLENSALRERCLGALLASAAPDQHQLWINRALEALKDCQEERKEAVMLELVDSLVSRDWAHISQGSRGALVVDDPCFLHYLRLRQSALAEPLPQ
jgi:hypothetical protein